MGLRVKLLAVLCGSVIVALAGAIFLAHYFAQGELSRYITTSHRDIAENIAPIFADYYKSHGGWQGVNGPEGISLLSVRDPQTSESQLSPITLRAQLQPVLTENRVILVEPNGHVVADSMNRETDELISSNELSQWIPVIANGQVVGRIFVGIKASVESANLESLFGERFGSILLWSGLLAGGVALLLGGIFSARLVAPLRSMQLITEKIAAGDLASRADSERSDELGQLARSFNQMASQLQESQRVRRQMVADIAHELRTPLSVIQGNLEAMSDGIIAPDAKRIQSIYEEALLLTRLVEDLRTLSLVDSRELHLRKDPVDLSSLLEGLIESLQPEIEERQLDLHVAVGQHISLMADADRLRQILLNLLSNAIQHTPLGGRISVTCDVIEMQARFAVRDSGAGIPAEEQKYLFNRFYRGKRSRLRKGSTGLGLAICKALVEAHGGKIWAESSADQGTTFSFTLPLNPS